MPKLRIFYSPFIFANTEGNNLTFSPPLLPEAVLNNHFVIFCELFFSHICCDFSDLVKDFHGEGYVLPRGV